MYYCTGVIASRLARPETAETPTQFIARLEN